MNNSEIKILIIDDEKNIREGLAESLNEKDYKVYQAKSSREALSYLNKNSFDIALTDLKMPETDGIEFLKIVKEKQPDIDVIIMTAYGTVETAVEALKKGAYDYLTKPIDIKNLRTYIKNLAERRRLIKENLDLKSKLRKRLELDGIIGTSLKIKEIYDLIDQVSQTDVTILLEGESGTGKELVATAIHRKGLRKNKPFVTLNCGAFPETLIESELFGYEKGAFTGANTQKKGRLENAQSGTIFLDEIGELSLKNQVDLLRVLENHEFTRLGGLERIEIDIRVIAASNKNLNELCKAGKFREDLFYRLNVITIVLPPLRERIEDIPVLAEAFLIQFSEKYNKTKKELSKETMKLLINYPFPGNIRELKNILERATILSKGKTIQPEDLPPSICKSSPYSMKMEVEIGSSIEEMEKELIIKTLSKVGGHREKAAEILGISVRALHYKLNKYNIIDKEAE